uniref:NADAR domain-containing protein n=1 Tax=Romanomermis culicivorax TaxID=13658 RepID=A0A915KIU1_ROMCU
MNPVEQKHIGGRIYKPCLKYQWNNIKSLIIFTLDKSKLQQLPELYALLKSTGERPIIEFIRSDYWGIGRKGIGGQNTAGNILSMIRSANFPPYILIGDSIVKNICFENCAVFQCLAQLYNELVALQHSSQTYQPKD